MRIVFDIGGTNMRVARSTDGRTIEHIESAPTPPRYADGVAALTQLVRSACDGAAPTAIAGGVPGPLDREHARLLRAPHLPDWVGKPLKEDLERALGAPVRLENDTALVGLGEAVAGAGRDVAIVAYCTVSTGINGALIVDGRIAPTAVGFEIGHQIIDVDGSVLGIGTPTTLEQLAAGAELAARFGVPMDALDDPAVWEAVARHIAVGLHNTILHWSPERVVLGGGLITSGAVDLDRVRTHLRELLTIFPDPPTIVRPELGDGGGLHGALALLRGSRIGYAPA